MLSFSIVIPTTNRYNSLRRCLYCISRLKYQHSKFEILVIDNSSALGTKTKEVLDEFKSNNPGINSRYLSEKKLGPSFARNLGIRKARYPYIVCLDDDVLPPENLLISYSNILTLHPDLALLAGKIVAISGNSKKLNYFLKILREDLWVFSQTIRKEKILTRLKFPDDLISANILINRKKIKDTVFNEKFGRMYGKNLIFSEDLILSLQALYDGKKVFYDPTIVSKHIIGNEKLNYKYILNRFFRAGIEHKLIDREFADKGIKSYEFSLRLLIKFIKVSLTKPNISNTLKLFREVLFLIGYFFPLTNEK